MIADAPSCVPSSQTTLDDTEFCTEVDAYVNAVMNTLPATNKILDKIRDEQNSDRSCVQLVKMVGRTKLNSNLKPFHSISTELSLQDGLLMHNSRIVIPKSLQPEILQKLPRHCRMLRMSKILSLVTRHQQILRSRSEEMYCLLQGALKDNNLI